MKYMNKISILIKNFFIRQNLKYYYYLNLKEKDYPKELKKLFKENTGKDLDLDNPKTFNEKLQWIKLYDNYPLKTILADKLAVRNWIEKQLGTSYLKNIYGSWNRFEDIDFNVLPDSFVLKTNHGCKMNYVVTDKKDFLTNDKEKAKKIFRKWLKTNFAFCGGFELQYQNITPRVFAEELMQNRNNQNLEDFEFFCFNGEPKLLMYSSYNNNEYKSSFYDENLNKLPLKIFEDEETADLPPTENIDRLFKISKKLSQNFKFVRVDFMRISQSKSRLSDLKAKYNEKIVFSEMTFTPHSGYYNFIPEEYDYIIGNWLDIKKQQKK